MRTSRQPEQRTQRGQPLECSIHATGMSTDGHKTVQLGELVAAAFDDAAQYSTDPRKISRLATKAVLDLLRRAQEVSRAPSQLLSLGGGVS